MKRFFGIFILLNFIITNLSFAYEDEIKKHLKNDFKLTTYRTIYVRDTFVEETLPKNLKIKDNTNIKNSTYTESLILKVYPKTFHTTKKDINEGEYIDFILAEDFIYKNKQYKKGSSIKARIENINQNGVYGLPSELVVGNFTFADNTKPEGEMNIRGADRSLWIYPISSLSSLIIYKSGVIFMPIRGGHAKLKPNKIYEIKVY